MANDVIKISELPESVDYGNLYTIGTHIDGQFRMTSKKVPLAVLGKAVTADQGVKVNGTEAPKDAQNKVNLMLDKATVGLGNVNNTSDADKPVSTAQAAAIAVETARATRAEAELLEKIDAVSHPYLSLERLRQYLYRVTFDSLPEDNGGDSPIVGGCSSYVANGKLYTNLDWSFDNTAEFIIRTKDFEGVGFVSGLNDGMMDDELIARLPYRVRDGINNYGIQVSTHVLFNDWEWTGCGERSINLTRLPFLVLSRVKSMATIASDLSGVLDNVYAPEGLLAMDYLIQFVVTDGTTTYAIIPPTSEGESYEVMDITECPKLTNFRPVGRETVARTDTDMQDRPTGVERYNMMPCPLEDLRFTLAYEEPDRLSEFIGLRGTDKDSTDAQLEAIYTDARALYLSRERDGQTWQTMHSVVYGNKMESLWIQENWEDNIIASATGGSDVTKEYVANAVSVETERAERAEQALDNAKQDSINDLEAIRSNAAAGKTASDNLHGHTVLKDVPADAKFTDTVYDDTAIKARATALEGQVNKVVLDGMTASEDGSTVKLTLAKINIKTGDTATTEVSLPVASADDAGVMNPQTYGIIQQNQTLINALIGASVAVSGLAAEPTQAQVTTAWLTASGLEELVNGARLFDVTNSKVWTYYDNTELWYPVSATGGGVTISQWTNGALGTIKGVADNAQHTNDGKLTAELDGTGSVLGWDRLKSEVAGKQGAINDLATIRSNAEAGAGAATTIAGFGDIVTHDADEFATSEQGTKADNAVSFDSAQTLTEEQMAQARENIGAGKPIDIIKLG